MGSEVQGPWGLSQISGMVRGAPGRKDPEVRWATGMAWEAQGRQSLDLVMASGTPGEQALNTALVTVMAQGGREPWGLVVLVAESPLGPLGEQSLRKGVVTGTAQRCPGGCGLETEMVVVLPEGGLRDLLVPRVAWAALTEGPWVTPGRVQRPGGHPEAGGILALQEGIILMAVWGVRGQRGLWGEVASGPRPQWRLLGRDTQGQNQGARGE